MSVEAVDNASEWYVVHTHLKQEGRANNNLKIWGVKTLYPKLRSRRVNEFTGAVTYITKPLFPRYIFAFSSCAVAEKTTSCNNKHTMPILLFMQFSIFVREMQIQPTIPVMLLRV